LTLPDYALNSPFWGYVFAAGVFAALLIAAGIVDVLLRLVAGRLHGAGVRGLRAQIVNGVRGPVVLFIVILGIFLGFLALTQHPSLAHLAEFRDWARKIWTVVLIAEVAYLIHHSVSIVLEWYIQNLLQRTQTRADDRLVPLIRRVLPAVVYPIAVLMALASLNISISPIWAGLGIGGLAVALALQPTLSNFFAGTYVVSEGELSVGDYIELENGPAGYIISIGWRSTKIRTWLNNLVIIPNSRMADTPIYNYYRPVPAVNVLVYCGVSYESDLDVVEEVVLDECHKLIESSQHAVKNVEPWFAFEEFGQSNITFWVFLQARDRIGSFVLNSEIVKAIRRRLRAEGIEINYPVRKLVFPTTNGRMPWSDTQEERMGQSDRQGDVE
jgi:small-conductance mechanosensitive channel